MAYPSVCRVGTIASVRWITVQPDSGYSAIIKAVYAQVIVDQLAKGPGSIFAWNALNCWCKIGTVTL